MSLISDGKNLYITKFNREGLWVHSLVTGKEHFLEVTRRLTDRTHWISRPDGLFFIFSDAKGRHLGRLETPDSPLEVLTAIRPRGLGPGLSLDPDGHRVFLSELQAHEQDLVLVELGSGLRP